MLNHLKSNSVIGALLVSMLLPTVRPFSFVTLVLLVVYKVKFQRQHKKLSFNQIYAYVSDSQASPKLMRAFWVIMGVLVITSIAIVVYSS